MNVVAILNPINLLGQELRDTLDRRKDLWRTIKLLTTDPELAGTVTEVSGSAALVQAYEVGALDDVDLLLACRTKTSDERILSSLPAGATAILLSPDQPMAAGISVVAGVNLDSAQRGRILVSPAPAVVLLAHLLHPLRRLRPAEVVAQVIQPASVHGQEGLDELFEQTRSILAFQGKKPEAVFGHQLAFNLLPVSSATGATVEDLQNVLQYDGGVAVQIVQGGVFHCLAASVFVQLDSIPSKDEVEQAFDEYPLVDRIEDASLLGPIEAAARNEVLLGGIKAAPGRPGGYWLWAVMDNLTRGGAANALEIAEAVLSAQA